MQAIDKTITLDGMQWRVLSTGADRNGLTYCHLASLTTGRHQKNGWVPHQICDWVPNDVLKGEK